MDVDLEEFDREESDFERRLSILLKSHVQVVEKKYVQEDESREGDVDKRKLRKRRSSRKKRFVDSSGSEITSSFFDVSAFEEGCGEEEGSSWKLFMDSNITFESLNKKKKIIMDTIYPIEYIC